jgi:putative FmdB family regulatory protein
MAIYDYDCAKCQTEYEVIKSIHAYNGKDPCPLCGNIGQRIIRPVVFYGEKVQNAEYNIGLGKITKNKQHRDELAKRMNVTEIGNEKPELIHKKFETDRAEKNKKSWDEV